MADISELATELCKTRANLPDDWRVYLYEAMPRRAQTYTHIDLTGAKTKICSRGPRKGERIWCKPWQDRQSFLFSSEEWNRVLKRFEEETAQETKTQPTELQKQATN